MNNSPITFVDRTGTRRKQLKVPVIDRPWFGRLSYVAAALLVVYGFWRACH